MKRAKCLRSPACKREVVRVQLQQQSVNHSRGIAFQFAEGRFNELDLAHFFFKRRRIVKVFLSGNLLDVSLKNEIVGLVIDPNLILSICPLSQMKTWNVMLVFNHRNQYPLPLSAHHIPQKSKVVLEKKGHQKGLS